MPLEPGLVVLGQRLPIAGRSVFQDVVERIEAVFVPFELLDRIGRLRGLLEYRSDGGRADRDAFRDLRLLVRSSWTGGLRLEAALVRPAHGGQVRRLNGQIYLHPTRYPLKTPPSVPLTVHIVRSARRRWLPPRPSPTHAERVRSPPSQLPCGGWRARPACHPSGSIQRCARCARLGLSTTRKADVHEPQRNRIRFS